MTTTGSPDDDEILALSCLRLEVIVARSRLLQVHHETPSLLDDPNYENPMPHADELLRLVEGKLAAAKARKNP